MHVEVKWASQEEESTPPAPRRRDARLEPWVETPWRRKWQPAPVFLLWRTPWTEEPGRLWGHKSRTRLSELTTHQRGLLLNELLQSEKIPVPSQAGGPSSRMEDEIRNLEN